MSRGHACTYQDALRSTASDRKTMLVAYLDDAVKMCPRVYVVAETVKTIVDPWSRQGPRGLSGATGRRARETVNICLA